MGGGLYCISLEHYTLYTTVSRDHRGLVHTPNHPLAPGGPLN